MTERNRGSIALARLGHTQLELARRLDVSTGIVAYWISGERKPKLPNRQMLLQHFKIPIEAWDQPTSPLAPAPSAPPTEWGENTVTGRIETLEGMVQGLMDHARKQLAAEGSGSTMLEQAKVMSSLAHTLGTLRRLKGEEIAETRVLRHPKWIGLKSALIAALEPYPEAVQAVTDAIESVERRTG